MRSSHRRRRALLGLGMLAVSATVIGLLVGAGVNSNDPIPSESVAEPLELPRGGTELLPAHRLVGFYGAPQDPALGELGIGAPARASRLLRKQARPYERNRPILPFFELLATIANAHPGDDGKYRTRQPAGVIDRYLRQARADRALLVLDIQPGRASFGEEIRPLRRYLREPDVGLGIDPEWHVGQGEVPGQVIGSVDGQEVNRIAARLSRIVKRHGLPEKLLIVHRFTESMVVDPERLRTHPGVATVLNVDGIGAPAEKIAKYDDLHAPRRSGLFTGFKLFYSEDTDLMAPRDVLRLNPTPDLVVYE